MLQAILIFYFCGNEVHSKLIPEQIIQLTIIMKMDAYLKKTFNKRVHTNSLVCIFLCDTMELIKVCQLIKIKAFVEKSAEAFLMPELK